MILFKTVSWMFTKYFFSPGLKTLIAREFEKYNDEQQTVAIEHLTIVVPAVMGKLFKNMSVSDR